MVHVVMLCYNLFHLMEHRKVACISYHYPPLSIPKLVTNNNQCNFKLQVRM